MFKNAIIYRMAVVPALSLAQLEERAKAGEFVECGASQAKSAGWTPPRGEKHGALIESVGGELLLTLTSEKRAVPARTVKRELEKRLDKIEADTGRRPKGKKAKELKEELVHELLPRAFPSRSSVPVWVSPERGLVVVGVGSTSAADTAASLLVELFGGELSLRMVQSAEAPATCMAAWLKDREPPAGFSIDRECELKQPDSEKAAVRYSNHTLELEEVAEHIAQGKLPTKLAMTWKGRVSFVLTEALAFKQIKLLDVVMEGTNNEGTAAGFDADAAIATGELGPMVADMIDALGGEAAPDLVEAAAQAEGAEGAAPAAFTGEASEDPMFDTAWQVVRTNKRASISLVQRHLRIGYNRAARLLEEMEKRRLVSPMQSDGSRTLYAAS